jgi:hypothetical protein
MHLMLQSGESILIFLTSTLATALHLVFGFLLISGGNFLKLLFIVATLQHFLQAVGFSNVLLTVSLLGTFVILRNVTFSAVTYVCLSVCLCLCTELLDSHSEDVHEDLRFKTFRKPVEKFDVLLVSDMNEGYFALQMYLIYFSTGRYAVGFGESN